MLIKIFFPQVYANVEIALLRIPIFVIGAYCGAKVYENRFIQNSEVLIFAGGIVKTAAYIDYLLGTPIKNIFNCRYGIAWFSLFLIFLIAVLSLKIPSGYILSKIVLKAGKYSLEIYLTHVTIRNLMNLVGLPTYQLQFYLICIAVSLPSAMVLKFVSSKAAGVINTCRKLFINGD